MSEVKIVNAGLQVMGKKSRNDVAMHVNPNAATPGIEPDFVFDPMSWHGEILSWFCNYSYPLYIYGESGAGKTTCVKQIAARLNYPVYELTGSASMEPRDLLGSKTLDAPNGQTITAWQDGALVKAMRDGGILLINEMDACNPDALIVLNSVLDGSPVCLEDSGTVIYPDPMFRFVATGNTNGTGNVSGRYTGTLCQNFALRDRFMWVVADYIPRDAELALLKKKASLSDDCYNIMLDFAGITRAVELPKDLTEFENLLPPMTTRSLLKWADMLATDGPTWVKRKKNAMRETLDRAFARGVDAGQRAALFEILNHLTKETGND